MILQFFFVFKNFKKFFVSSQLAFLKKPFPKWKKGGIEKKKITVVWNNYSADNVFSN
jgi:hypothetical protein